jgi:fructose-1,6-bisphosphatase/inositol monophosphatase family enzyme
MQAVAAICAVGVVGDGVWAGAAELGGYTSVDQIDSAFDVAVQAGAQFVDVGVFGEEIYVGNKENCVVLVGPVDGWADR